MNQAYLDQLGVPASYTVEKIEGHQELRGGQDTDITVYDVRDETGLVVATYEIHDSTSIAPPFGRSVTCRRSYGNWTPLHGA